MVNTLRYAAARPLKHCQQDPCKSTYLLRTPHPNLPLLLGLHCSKLASSGKGVGSDNQQLLLAVTGQ